HLSPLSGGRRGLSSTERCPCRASSEGFLSCTPCPEKIIALEQSHLLRLCPPSYRLSHPGGVEREMDPNLRRISVAIRRRGPPLT
ncbi:hypothetical protein AVEN_168580-1, partial [Araneus ventricosus]